MKSAFKFGLVLLGIGLVVLASMRFARLVELRSYGKSPLWDAVRSSNSDDLLTLLELGADPNQIDTGNRLGERIILLNHFTMHAVHDHTLSNLLLLLENGADPNLRDSDGLNAYEINLMHIELYELDEPHPGHSSRRVLYEAMQKAGAVDSELSLILTKQWDTLRQWILDDPSLVSRRYYLNRTILHLSASTADEEFIRFLVEMGVDVNALDDFDMTPAMTSLILNPVARTKIPFSRLMGSRYRSAHAIPVLTELGTDIEQVSTTGHTLLHLIAGAARSPAELDALGQPKNINLVNSDKQTAFDIAIDNTNRVSLKWLLDHGAPLKNPNAQVNPLVDLMNKLRYLPPDHYEFNQVIVEPVIVCIQILLEAGADPLDDTLFYNTPWQVAKDIQCAPCLELLSEVLIQRAAYLVSNAH